MAGGGAGRDRLGGVGEGGLGSIPLSHNPTLPTAPFPTHNTWSTLGQSQLDKHPATPRASRRGGGVQVGGVGLLVTVLGVGGPQVKTGPLQRILGAREGRHPTVAVGGHHQQHVPHVQVNGILANLHRLPQGRPRLHLHLVLLRKAEETTPVTTRDVPVVRGKHLRTCGNFIVEELGPTPNTCDNDDARRHWVQLPDLKDTFHDLGGGTS